MSKHTPGDWGRNIKPASKYPIIFAGRNTHVARVITDGLTEQEAEANADLIAAAPDLLDALKIAAMALDLAALVPGDAYWQQQGRSAARTAREAIAKATGSAS